MSTGFRDLDEGIGAAVSERPDPAWHGAEESFDQEIPAGDEAFDNASFADPDLFASVEENKPEEQDEMYPRYGMSALLPISLYRQTNGNNSFGDFNKKNPITGANDVNFNYYPSFVMIPLVGGSFDIPAENEPTMTNEPIQAAPFDFGEFQRNPRRAINRVFRSPRECGAIFLDKESESGGFLFGSLVGYHVNDRDKGVAAARRLVETIMPALNREIFPPTERVKGGIKFRGPFLDELMAFVTTKSLDRLKASSLSDADKAVGVRLQQEMRRALQDGTNRANAWLDQTEAEIKNPTEIKKSYDSPNLETYDAPVSTDLYCLAQTNRTELDLRSIKESEAVGAGLAEPMREALNRFADVAERMNAPANVPGNVMSIDDVKKLMDEQAAAITARFEERIAELDKPAETPVDPPKTEGTDDGKPAGGRRGTRAAA